MMSISELQRQTKELQIQTQELHQQTEKLQNTIGVESGRVVEERLRPLIAIDFTASFAIPCKITNIIELVDLTMDTKNLQPSRMQRIDVTDDYEFRNAAVDILETCAKSEFHSMVKYMLESLKKFTNAEDRIKIDKEIISAESCFIAGDYCTTLGYMTGAAHKLNNSCYAKMFKRLKEGMLTYILICY